MVNGNENEKEKEIEVKHVQKLAMSSTDVLFVTIHGSETSQEMYQHLYDELKMLLGHERFMIISDAIKLQVVSGLPEPEVEGERG